MDELEPADAGDSVCVRTCRDSMESNMVRSVLADAGVRCFVQGEHHRAMLGFMGPYIDLRVPVAQHDAARATSILSALDQATPELATSDAEGAADLAAPSENLVFRIVGEQVAAARKLLRITLTDLATATGLTQWAIINFEGGKNVRAETGDRRPETGDRRPARLLEAHCLNVVSSSLTETSLDCTSAKARWS